MRRSASCAGAAFNQLDAEEQAAPTPFASSHAGGQSPAFLPKSPRAAEGLQLLKHLTPKELQNLLEQMFGENEQLRDKVEELCEKLETQQSHEELSRWHLKTEIDTLRHQLKNQIGKNYGLSQVMREKEHDLCELVEHAENVNMKSIILAGKLARSERSSQEEGKEVHVSFLEEDEKPNTSKDSHPTEEGGKYDRFTPRSKLTSPRTAWTPRSNIEPLSTNRS